MTGYRFFECYDEEIFSVQNGEEWEVLKWKKTAGPLEICRAGYHFCFSPYDALQCHQGNTFAKVEIRGPIARDETKCCAHSMRILHLYPATILYRMAAMAARIVLPNFEKVHPEDKRPRLAIEALEECIQKNSFSKELLLLGDAAASVADYICTVNDDSAVCAADSVGTACTFVCMHAQGAVNSIDYIANAVYYAHLSANSTFKGEFNQKVINFLERLK